MELNAKDKILLALYLEYQKDIPDMNSIKASTVDVDINTFNANLKKLQDQGLIRGMNMSYASGKVYIVWLSDTYVTQEGERYIESRFTSMDNDTKTGKITEIIKNATAFGWNEMKDIAARTLAEIMK